MMLFTLHPPITLRTSRCPCAAQESGPSGIPNIRNRLRTVREHGLKCLKVVFLRTTAAEFQKVLDHRGIVFADPIGALAYVQLGRAYHLVGDEVKVKASYQDFLTLWRDAAPDIPILSRVKAEYAKLQ